MYGFFIIFFGLKKKRPIAPRLNFSTRRWAGGKAQPFHHPASVLRGPNIKGFGLYCLAAISTHRYAPLTFDPAPRDSRDDRDDVLDTAPALKKAVTAVTVVTLGEDPGSG